MARTRRLFTTLNKTAKKVSQADTLLRWMRIIPLQLSLSRLVDDFPLFADRALVSFAATSALQESDQTSVTSIIGLFELVRDLYPRKHKKWPRNTIASRTRADDNIVEEVVSFNERYWAPLLKKCVNTILCSTRALP